VHFDPTVIDGEPAAAVEDAAAPAADLGHLSGMAERAQVGGVELTSVVDGEVPVAVRPAAREPPSATLGRWAGRPVARRAWSGSRLSWLVGRRSAEAVAEGVEHSGGQCGRLVFW
jgi:hypothetical protein